jgi:glycosyltransferase involved in cell wall biosynthesis
LLSVATYRRPELLRRLLDSLFSGGIGESPVDIVVVDNDPEQSALREWGSDERVRVIAESTPGIPYARNAGLDQFGEQYWAIVFADDDEWAAPGWIDALVAAQRQTAAGAVAGWVVTVGEGLARVIQRTKHPHLSVRPAASTNNSLLTREAWVRAGRPRFDPAFAETGGEDSDFFFGLHQAGVNIVFAADAVLYEDLPADRVSWGWLIRRTIGQGQSQLLIARKHRQPLVRWTLRAVAETVGCAGLTLLDLIRGQGLRSPWLKRGLFAAGKVSALFAPQQRLYRR